MNNKLYMRTYLSLEDLYKDIDGTLVDSPYLLNSAHDIFYLYEKRFGKTFQADSHITNLWMNYICPKYWNCTIAYSDNYIYDIEEEFLNGCYDNFMTMAVQYLVSSSIKYSKIIDLYDSEKSNLMNKLSSTSLSKSKFNDTPQGGTNDFTSDNYTSNYTENENTTETDSGTVLQRLSEVQKEWDNIYNKWSNEFMRFIIQIGD